MRMIGLELWASTPGQLKAVWNETGLIIFPVHLQHNQAGVEGIRYQETGGNALAVLIHAPRFEVRGHPEFSVHRVYALWKILQKQPGLERLRSYQITYQGRELSAPFLDNS